METKQEKNCEPMKKDSPAIEGCTICAVTKIEPTERTNADHFVTEEGNL